MGKPHVFTASPLDRASHLRRDEGWLGARLGASESRVLPLWRLKVLISPDDEPSIAWQPAGELASFAGGEEEAVFLGLGHGVAHFAVGVAVNDDPARAGPLAGKGKFIDVRTIAPHLAEGEAAILAQARSLVDWHTRHRFCAACGAPTVAVEGGHLRRCTKEGCAVQHFPRTDPVVIMLVAQGDRCLLGRQPVWPKGVYSALAGFVEPGETIEEAVRREVREEAGVRVGAVRYHSSQPWPFPSSLMVGCMAEARSEEISIDGVELEEARWFNRDEIGEMAAAWHNMRALRLPPPMAIAHQLCRAWLRGE